MLRILSIAGLLLVLSSCRPEIPDNCEGRYSFKRPYTISHPQGRLKKGDTIALHLELPITVYNYSSDSMVNINRFNKVLCGFLVYEMLPDSTNGVGIKSVNAKNEFKYNSPNVKLDFTEGVGGTNRVRYYLKKTDTSFFATINLIVLRKGIFNIQLLNGFIEDAFCRSGISAYWTEERLIYSFENYKKGLAHFQINRTHEQLEFIRLNNTTNYYFLVE